MRPLGLHLFAPCVGTFMSIPPFQWQGLFRVHRLTSLQKRAKASIRKPFTANASDPGPLRCWESKPSLGQLRRRVCGLAVKCCRFAEATLGRGGLRDPQPDRQKYLQNEERRLDAQSQERHKRLQDCKKANPRSATHPATLA